MIVVRATIIFVFSKNLSLILNRIIQIYGF